MKESIRLLGISASPRRDGNSMFVLDAALEAVTSFDGADVIIDKIDFFGKKVLPCIACYACIDAKGDCVLQDDFTTMRDAWLRADAVLHSIPVFAMNIPGQLKCFYDRLANSQLFSDGASGKRLKTVGTVSQGMHFAAGQEGVIREISNLAMLLGCLPVAGDSYHGVRGWTYEKLSRSTYKKRLEAEDKATLRLIEEARGLARDLVIVALRVRHGTRACKDLLAAHSDYAAVLRRLGSSG